MIKKALGRGLSSLIPEGYVLRDGEGGEREGLAMIPIGEIGSSPDQPRQEFSPEGLEELAQSIREKGVLQPVIVKRAEGEGGGEVRPYELVCGERRLKAAVLAGLEKVPAVIKDVAESEVLEWALIENIQREDLNPLEEAKAFERLLTERGLSQEEVAKRIGKNRSTVTNCVRLLRLPEEVRGMIREERLTAGHARALLGLFTESQQIDLARRIAKENLSVRQVEEIVGRSARKRRARQARRLTPEVADLEARLSRLFGTEVRVFTTKGGREGRVVIHYYSLDELDRILAQAGLSSY